MSQTSGRLSGVHTNIHAQWRWQCEIQDNAYLSFKRHRKSTEMVYRMCVPCVHTFFSQIQSVPVAQALDLFSFLARKSGNYYLPLSLSPNQLTDSAVRSGRPKNSLVRFFSSNARISHRRTKRQSHGVEHICLLLACTGDKLLISLLLLLFSSILSFRIGHAKAYYLQRRWLSAKVRSTCDTSRNSHCLHMLSPLAV